MGHSCSLADCDEIGTVFTAPQCLSGDSFTRRTWRYTRRQGVQTPRIERHAFSVSRTRLARTHRVWFLSMAPVMTMVWAVGTRPHDMNWERLPSAFGLLAATLLLLAAAVWLWFRSDLRRLRSIDPVLVLARRALTTASTWRHRFPGRGSRLSTPEPWNPRITGASCSRSRGRTIIPNQ